MIRKIVQGARTELLKLQSSLTRKYNRYKGIRLSSTPYVSGDSFRALADHIFDDLVRVDSDKVHCGDIVFVQGDDLTEFMSECLADIQNPFILVSHNSDNTVDERFVELVNHPKVYHWFAVNNVLTHKKITSIPIGLENRWRHNNGIIQDFDRIASSLPLKKNRILFGFNLHTNEAERRPALAALERCTVADKVTLHSGEYRKALSEYFFVASPPGNGIDCHRTWEALYFKTIPIVRHSRFFDGFPDLPVHFINEWSDLEKIQVSKLDEIYRKLSPSVDTTPYIWMNYWEGLLDRKKQECILNR